MGLLISITSTNLAKAPSQGCSEDWLTVVLDLVRRQSTVTITVSKFGAFIPSSHLFTIALLPPLVKQAAMWRNLCQGNKNGPWVRVTEMQNPSAIAFEKATNNHWLSLVAKQPRPQAGRWDCSPRGEDDYSLPSEKSGHKSHLSRCKTIDHVCCFKNLHFQRLICCLDSTVELAYKWSNVLYSPTSQTCSCTSTSWKFSSRISLYKNANYLYKMVSCLHIISLILPYTLSRLYVIDNLLSNVGVCK